MSIRTYKTPPVSSPQDCGSRVHPRDNPFSISRTPTDTERGDSLIASVVVWIYLRSHGADEIELTVHFTWRTTLSLYRALPTENDQKNRDWSYDSLTFSHNHSKRHLSSHFPQEKPGKRVHQYRFPLMRKQPDTSDKIPQSPALLLSRILLVNDRESTFSNSLGA